MKLALEQAEKAMAVGEVPVGCIIVDKNNKVISSSFNLKESNHDPCGHAEIIAIREAAKVLGNWRLKDCRMYVTLEPCIMCAGALIHARVDRIIFASNDSKVGVFSQGLLDRISHQLNHQFSVTAGICNEQAQTLIRDFFRHKRNLS